MTERRLCFVVAALSALGAAVASYLVVMHLTNGTVACVTGGCATVQESRYAELAGIPVAALGLVGYVVLAASAAFRSDLARVVGAATALGGFVFAIYLAWVQVAVLDAICQWCVTSDALLALLVPVTLLRLRVPTGAPGL